MDYASLHRYLLTSFTNFHLVKVSVTVAAVVVVVTAAVVVFVVVVVVAAVAAADTVVLFSFFLHGIVVNDFFFFIVTAMPSQLSLVWTMHTHRAEHSQDQCVRAAHGDIAWSNASRGAAIGIPRSG